MSIIKAEGIVLRSMKMGETSKLLTLFTREHGILKVIAKGSRSRKSRFGATLELLNVIHLVYYHKDSRDLQLLSAADLVETFPSLAADLERWAYACACGELIVRAHPGAEATPRLYPILIETLRALNGPRSETEARVCFWSLQMKLLGVFGIGPHLRRCLNCDVPSDSSASPIVHFHITRGGFFCEKCFSGTGALKLSASTLALLARLQTLPAAKLMRFSASEREAHEIELFYRSYFDFHLEEVGRLRALEFVRELT